MLFFGLLLATMLTLFVAPVFYDLLARYTRSQRPRARSKPSSMPARWRPAE